MRLRCGLNVKQILIPALSPLPHSLIPLQATSSLKPTGFDLSWKYRDLDSAEPKREAEMIKWHCDGYPKGSDQFKKSWTGNAGKKNAMWTLTVDGKVEMEYKDSNLLAVQTLAVITVDTPIQNHSTL